MKWNKEYIKDKEESPKVKIIGVAHTHTGGYYSDQCGGCLYENALSKKKNKK